MNWFSVHIPVHIQQILVSAFGVFDKVVDLLSTFLYSTFFMTIRNGEKIDLKIDRFYHAFQVKFSHNSEWS